ncbi:PREDICTED: uncharacterized protein LOC106107578 [Papilio polytes]|uniref:uncharacterized protein LOC106107578 n=1 Tax=Papilio polytes TaxID=76194 RepID=UPI00067610F9|nr:PREDICTED: uncharacterized protein LOC106107578 [Papilio polytes]
MKTVIIMLLFTLHLVVCYEEDADYEGGRCTTYTNEIGVCRYLYKCEYAIHQIRNKKKIKSCFYNGFKRYVCCLEKEKRPVTMKPKIKTPKWRYRVHRFPVWSPIRVLY